MWAVFTGLPDYSSRRHGREEVWECWVLVLILRSGPEAHSLSVSRRRVSHPHLTSYSHRGSFVYTSSMLLHVRYIQI